MTYRRGAASLNARIGSCSAVKRVLGITLAELQTLVAVAACERSVGGYPTRVAVRQITGGGRTNLMSELCAVGLLRQVDRTKDRQAVYGLMNAARELLGLDIGTEPPVVERDAASTAEAVATVLQDAPTVSSAAFQLRMTRQNLRARCVADEALRPLFVALGKRGLSRRRLGMERLRFSEADG